MAAPALQIDWAGIRAAAIALDNVSEAARRAAANLPPDERERFREAVSKRAVREQWLSKAEQAIVQPRTLAASEQQRTLSKNVQSGADSLCDALREDGDATKIAGMRYSRRVVEHAAAAAAKEPEKALLCASDVKAALQGAALVGNWQQAGGSNLVINIALLGRSLGDEG